MHSRWGLMPALLLGWTIANPALAQTPSADTLNAKQHYEMGLRKYDTGHFEQAAEEFEVAYQISGDVAILYNEAQAYRQARNWSKALLLYRTYMATFSRRGVRVPNRGELDARIAECEAKLGANPVVESTPTRPGATTAPSTPSEAAPPPPPQPAPPPPAPATTNQTAATPAPPPHAEPRHVLRPLGIAAVTVGGALVVVGAVMGGLAAQASNKLTSSNGEFTSSLRDTDVAGPRYQNAGIALLVTGGVIAVAGIIPLVLSRREHAPTAVAFDAAGIHF